VSVGRLEMLTLRVPANKVALVQALEFRIMDCLALLRVPDGIPVSG
jgi:hypothetical protein